MSSHQAPAAPHDVADQESGPVHAWRVRQLARLGLALPVAEAGTIIVGYR